MSFFKSVLAHAEVKRGASHLAVGAIIGVISAFLNRERVVNDDE